MLSQEERLLIGLQALERLRPRLKNRQSRLSRLAFPLRTDTAAGSLAEEVETTPPGPFSGQPESEAGLPPRVESVIVDSGPLSPYTLILGVCEDGLPFLLDLTNPAPGALLVVSDSAAGQQQFLAALLESAAGLNTPEQAYFHVIAPQPAEFASLRDRPHSHGVVSPLDSEAAGLLKTLDELSERRRRGPEPGPAVVLAIHDLASFLDTLDQEGFVRLYHLVKHGPRARIWTIATLNAAAAAGIDDRLIAAFRTRILGQILDPDTAGWLSGQPDPPAARLDSETQFCAPFGEGWLHFWACSAK